MDYIKLVDKVLLNTKNHFEDKNAKSILTEEDKKYYKKCMAFLEKRGYVSTTIENPTEKQTNITHYITIEGLIILSRGNVSAQLKREAMAARLQSWQTWAIALGTVAAGIYGLFELGKGLCLF